MQEVMISGALMGDSEKMQDKNGDTLVKFKVSCTNNHAKTKVTIYRCWTFDTNLAGMKDKAQVTVIGELNITLRKYIQGRQWINLDVYAKAVDITAPTKPANPRYCYGARQILSSEGTSLSFELRTY